MVFIFCCIRSTNKANALLPIYSLSKKFESACIYMETVATKRHRLLHVRPSSSASYVSERLLGFRSRSLCVTMHHLIERISSYTNSSQVVNTLAMLGSEPQAIEGYSCRDCILAARTSALPEPRKSSCISGDNLV